LARGFSPWRPDVVMSIERQEVFLLLIFIVNVIFLVSLLYNKDKQMPIIIIIITIVFQANVFKEWWECTRCPESWLTHVQMLFTLNLSPIQPSKLCDSFEYLLLPPRSELESIPPALMGSRFLPQTPLPPTRQA